MSVVLSSADTEYLDSIAAALLAANMPVLFVGWLKSPTITTERQIIAHLGDQGGSDERFDLSNDSAAGTFEARQAGSSGSRSADTATSPDNDTWHHGAAFLKSSTSRTVWLDGGGSVTDTQNAGTSGGFDAFVVGAGWRIGALEGYVNGKIAEVALYDCTGLTDTQVSNAVAALAGGAKPEEVLVANLIEHWMLLDGPAGTGGIDLIEVGDGISYDTGDHPVARQAGLVPVALNQAQSIETAALTQHHALSIAGLTQAQALDAPALTQHHALAPAALDQAQAIAAAMLTQHYALAVAELLQAQALDALALTEHHQLAIAALAQAQTLGTVPLTQHHALAPLALDQAQTLAAAALTQHNALAPAGLDQAQTLDTTSLSVAGTVSVQGLDQAQSLDTVLLVQHHLLAPAGLAQAQTVETPGVSVAYSLAIAGLDQAQALDATALTPGGAALVVVGLTQAQALDPAALAQHNVLVVDDLVQQQLIDGVAFGGAVGWLRGTVVVVSALDGTVTIAPALRGAVRLN